MSDIAKTKSTLIQLVSALKGLVETLRRDGNCPWTSKFETDLTNASALLDKCGEDELRSLSASIRHVFKGTGSFNDYAPAKFDPSTGKYNPIPGTDDFEKVAREVFDLSAQLIVK